MGGWAMGQRAEMGAGDAPHLRLAQLPFFFPVPQAEPLING